MVRYKDEIKFLKGLLSFFIVWLLINPITIYLLCKNIIFAITSPIIATIILFLTRNEIHLSRIKIYYFNLLLIISIAYHTELIFRINFPERNIPNLYEIRGKYFFNKPNIIENFTDLEYSSMYITNSQGFRIDLYDDPEKKITQCDWLFLGDSYTQGAQVNYQDLFTTRTYQYFPNKIILNAGISGFSIIDEFNYYISQGYKLKPKIVFLQLCIFNDFMNVTENSIGLAEYMMQYSAFYRYLFYNLKHTNPNDLPLSRWTEPFYPTEQGNQNFNIFYTESSDQKREDIKQLILYLKRFKNETSKNGTELCILLIPTKEQVSYRHFEEVVNNFKIEVPKLDMFYPNRLMDSLSNILDFDLIDLHPEFSDGKGFPFFEQDEHLNIWGHIQVSNAIKKKYSTSVEFEYLSKSNTGDRYPTFNSMGILYQSLVNGTFQVCLTDTAFNKQTVLTNSNIHKLHPSFSSDQSRLVYTQGDQDKLETNVVIESLEYGTKQIATNSASEYGAIPSISQSGQLIAYPSWWKKDGRMSNPIIMLYDISSGRKKALTKDKYESWRPIFHPNDTLIFYLSKEYQRNFTIICQNIYTNEKKIILKANYDIWDPAISKDGQWIVFAGHKDENWDLFLLNLYTYKVQQLTHTNGNEWDPSFGLNEKDIWFSGTFGTNNGVYRLRLR